MSNDGSGCPDVVLVVKSAADHLRRRLLRPKNKTIGVDTKAAARQSPNGIKKTKKYGEKRCSIWRIELLHPAMWQAGMTCYEIRPNVRRTGILLDLVLILTISPQSTCHSAPVCEIVSKPDHPQQKK